MSPLNRKFEITDAARGAAFTVRVVTRAQQPEIAGVQEDGTLRVRLTATSAGNPAANDELVILLADALGVEPSRLEVVAGGGAPDKLISVEGVSTADVEARQGQYREARYGPMALQRSRRALAGRDGRRGNARGLRAGTYPDSFPHADADSTDGDGRQRASANSHR